MNNNSKEALKRRALEEATKHRSVATTVELVRKRLEYEGASAIDTYNKQCERLEAEAQTRLQESILPWWREFSASEVFGQIQLALSGKFIPRLHVSSPIPYFWPREALSDTRDAGVHTRPFQIPAEGVVDIHKHKGGNLGGYISNVGNRYLSELWNATATIELSRNHTTFYFSRWPQKGGGFAFARVSHAYRIPIDEAIDTRSPDGLHPSVLIEFASQIQTGQVWNTLANSFEKNVDERS